jgi:hypothetical protein
MRRFPSRFGASPSVGSAVTAAIVGKATFGIGGLFGHDLAHGNDVVVDRRI